jgi:hypothetical protein
VKIVVCDRHALMRRSHHDNGHDTQHNDHHGDHHDDRSATFAIVAGRDALHTRKGRRHSACLRRAPRLSRVGAVPSVLVIVLWTLCLSATRIGLQGVHDVIDNGGFGAG